MISGNDIPCNHSGTNLTRAEPLTHRDQLCLRNCGHQRVSYVDDGSVGLREVERAVGRISCPSEALCYWSHEERRCSHHKSLRGSRVLRRGGEEFRHARSPRRRWDAHELIGRYGEDCDGSQRTNLPFDGCVPRSTCRCVGSRDQHRRRVSNVRAGTSCVGEHHEMVRTRTQAKRECRKPVAHIGISIEDDGLGTLEVPKIARDWTSNLRRVGCQVWSARVEERYASLTIRIHNRIEGRIQPVSATSSASFSDGVMN